MRALTPQQVLVARRCARLGVFYVDLARRYGVTTSTISRLVAGHTYKDAGGPRSTVGRGRRVRRVTHKTEA